MRRLTIGLIVALFTCAVGVAASSYFRSHNAKEFVPTVAQLTTIAFIIAAAGTPLIVLVKSVLDLWRATRGRIDIVLRGITALVIWSLISCGVIFMTFVAVFSAAHSGYRMSHGGAPDPSGSDDPAGMMIFLVAIYTIGLWRLVLLDVAPSESIISCPGALIAARNLTNVRSRPPHGNNFTHQVHCGGQDLSLEFFS
jgi:hypothetical protein